MSGEPTALREFIGFAWPEGDNSDQSGLLVLAKDVTEAAALAREVLGKDSRTSLWNEEDAAKPR